MEQTRIEELKQKQNLYSKIIATKTDLKEGNFETIPLYEWVCSNNIAAFEKYFNNGGKPNVRTMIKGKAYSLILLAFRAKKFEMVELLLKNGETIINNEVKEFVALKKQSAEIIARIESTLSDRTQTGHYIQCSYCEKEYDLNNSCGGSNPEFNFCPFCGKKFKI